MLKRAKSLELFTFEGLSETQKQNSNKNLEEIGDNKSVLSSFPRRIVLELTNSCNLSCIMCGRNYADFQNTFLELSQLEKLEKMLSVSEEVALIGWGESTIHPEFLNFLEYLHKFPVKKYLLTNGLKGDVLYKAVFDYNIDILAVSLDGTTPEMNDRIRRGSSFNKNLENLSRIIEEKERRNQKGPHINFVMTLMKSNLHQLPDMVRLAARLGVNEVKAVYLTVFGKDLLDESLNGCQETVRKVFDEALQAAEKLDIILKLPYIQDEDPAGEKLHRDCYVSWRDLYLGSDGYIRPCMSISKKISYIDDYEDIMDLWNQESFVDFRKKVNDPEKMPTECRRCYQSTYANWNLRSSFIQDNGNFAPKWDKK